MRPLALVWLLFAALATVGPASAARQAHGFEFAEAVTLDDGTVLALQELREVQRRFQPWQLIAFYARSKPEQEDELRQGLQPFAIDIVWLQEQPADMVQPWWQEAFDRVEPEPSRRAPLQPRIDRFKGVFDAGVAHGQRTLIRYEPDAGLRLRHAASEPLALVGLDMARLLVGVAMDALMRPSRPGNVAKQHAKESL